MLPLLPSYGLLLKAGMCDRSPVGCSLDPSGRYILRTRITARRSIRGFSLPPKCSRGERRRVEAIVKDAAEGLASDIPQLEGCYRSIKDMSDNELTDLEAADFLCEKPDCPGLVSSRVTRDWPDGRGVFVSENKSFVVWCNDTDHLQVISTTEGGGLGDVFEKFCVAMKGFENSLKKTSNNDFLFEDRFGYILTCPSNWGTGFRASVQVKLPHLSTRPELSQLLKQLKLQDSPATHLASRDDNIIDISTVETMGKTEPELISAFCDGISRLLLLEKTLERGEFVEDCMKHELQVNNT
eukprot:GHVQ01012642.1.p1 GENE.GHVQ01012642.1~~GHVQ01012642.1.p1  ORF type:complete len:297 (-),score=28.81 GHVQ01012642.1:1685-2575(-)